LLEDAPDLTGDERWNVLFAGLAEHLAMRDGEPAPGWSATRGLKRFGSHSTRQGRALRPSSTPRPRCAAVVSSSLTMR
jgi:hypothetical protein